MVRGSLCRLLGREFRSRLTGSNVRNDTWLGRYGAQVLVHSASQLCTIRCVQKLPFMMAMLLGCSDSRREVAPVAPKGEAVTGSQLRARDSCLMNSFDIRFHVLLPIRFSEAGAAASETRQLHSWICRRGKGDCEGVMFTMDNAESGKPIEPWDLIPIADGYLADETGEVFTIKWGAFRTFTVDLAEGKVRFVQSGDSAEGRGEATCTVTRA